MKTGRFKRLRAAFRFMESLSFLLEAELPLQLALSAGGFEEEGAEDAASREAFRKIGAGLEKGEAFASALRGSGLGLDGAQLAILEAGERTGDLRNSARTVAETLGARIKLRERSMAALAYPAAVSCAALIGSIAMAFCMASGSFGAGSSPKAAGPLLLSLSLVGSLLAAVALAWGLFTAILRSGGGLARKAEALRRGIPLVGEAREAQELSGFCLIVRSLCDSGLPLPQALRAARASLSSQSVRESADIALARLERGATASAAFESAAGMPRRICRWLRFAERTGSPEKAFAQLEKHYSSKAERLAERGMALAEPLSILAAGIILLILLGGLVASMLASAYGGLGLL